MTIYASHLEALLAPTIAAAKKSPHANKTNAERLLALEETYKQCTKCPLANQGRSQVVFGHGNPEATLMFVGEGPGRDEDKHGKPFIGRAGKLLTEMIEAMGLARDQVFISNTVKCRPPQNRTPLPSESAACISHLLLKEIAIIRPRTICTLGAAATQALLGAETKLKDVRGNFIQTEYLRLIPTYHPAYLLRNPSAKKIVWQDLQLIMGEI
jgi:uracil-DNA glycosylase family 4